jgi:hypothetical protein
LVSGALKSTASHYFIALLCCSLSVDLKRLGQAARGFIEQRQIAQLGATANIALRKDIAAHHHGFGLTSGLRSHNLLVFVHKWLAIKR